MLLIWFLHIAASHAFLFEVSPTDVAQSPVFSVEQPRIKSPHAPGKAQVAISSCNDLRDDRFVVEPIAEYEFDHELKPGAILSSSPRGPPSFVVVELGLDDGWFNASNRGSTDMARRLGREGEDAAGIVQDAKQRIPSVTRPGRYRIPDELTEVTLREIKNVAKQSNTSQLRDFLAHARATNRTFILETRANTKISGPLQRLIDRGLIDHRIIGQ